jgi:hypothetical protein
MLLLNYRPSDLLFNLMLDKADAECIITIAVERWWQCEMQDYNVGRDVQGIMNLHF